MKYEKYLSSYSENLKGKRYIVTGANSGLGFQTSRYLLFLEASVIMACRNTKRAEEAFLLLKQEFPNADLRIELYDQASFASIASFARRMKREERIDGLICNAGVYFPREGALTEDGFEFDDRNELYRSERIGASNGASFGAVEDPGDRRHFFNCGASERPAL